MAYGVARVTNQWAAKEEVVEARVEVPEIPAARGGAWQGFGWPDFWVFVAGGCGTRLWGWFLQAKV